MEYLEIGQVVNTHGIKGQIKIKPFTDDIEQFKNFKTLLIKQKGEIKEYDIENVKYINNCVVIKLEQIKTIEMAQSLRNATVLKPKDYSSLDEGNYYIVDLLGLDVLDEANHFLGKIYDIYNNGSCDIYDVKTNDGKSILLPAIADCIKQIDLKNKKIIVHILEGLDDKI